MVVRLGKAISAVLVALAILSSDAVSQDDIAKKIYASAADSVVLIYIEKDGKPFGQGSGFVIGQGRIITNAHVVRDGEPFLMAGPVKISLKIERVDTANDLALVRPAAEIVAPPLAIRAQDPAPGDIVFALGNPEGLEKTISQGIVSAVRNFNGRKLLQITSPVSHGSSGGPVLSKSAEVVGVTVGMFSEGQNLNFAIPASILSHFIESKEVGGDDVGQLIAQIDDINAARGDYSAEPDSSWQKTGAQIRTLFNRAIESSWSNIAGLKQVAGDTRIDSDLAVKANKRIVQLEPSGENYSNLAASQYWTILGSPDHVKTLAEAEANARLGISKEKIPTAQSDLILADILIGRENYIDGALYYKKALVAPGVTKEQEHSAMLGLIQSAEGLKNPTESERIFREMASKGEANYWDWDFEGDRLTGRASFADAGKAYETAASLSTSGFYRFSCSASEAYALAGDTYSDATLRMSRACISAAEKTDGTELVRARAHERIATILIQRGVYSEALSHAKEAVALDATNAFAYDDIEQALEDLGRTREAINAGQQAIKLSDGKFAWMHFNLGSAYFDAEDWKNAEQSFRKAAELNPQDDASAYNVAVCLLRQGYYQDAASWYEEVLRRNPKHKDRDAILQRIRTLRER